MKQNIFFSIISIFILYSCGTNTDEQIKQPDSAKISESISNNISLINQFNALEQIFSNDNWMIKKQNDTTYFYFSRINNFKVNIYQYHLIKGDSAKVAYTIMEPRANQIIWNFDEHQLHLESATKHRAVFSAINNDPLKWEFIRIDNNQIQMINPTKKQINWSKISPLSTFLIRSRYDYSHGTQLAFDSSKFNKK